MVYWANRSACRRDGGSNLNLQNIGGVVYWFGNRGMLWEELIHLLEGLIKNRPPPDYLVIQLGSNNLGLMKSIELMHNINLDLLRIRLLMPNTAIVWSDILPRRYWHKAIDGKAMEKARKRVNGGVRKYLRSIRSSYVIRHVNIFAAERYLYRCDGTHLSELGLNIYLNTFQAALESFIKTGGPQVFPPIE